MKLLQPYIEVENYNGVKIMKNIEKACRTCYRSEDKISDESYKTLLKNCLNRGHESVLEHEKITIRMVCDVGVYKDLTRHRIASFSIESTRYCVAGDTKLKFFNKHSKYTIKEMFDKKCNSKNGQWKRMKIKHLNENTGEFDYITIKDLFYNGKKKCYKIKTDLGYELTCTDNHRIYTPNGYVELKDLKTGDYIYVNGNNVDVLYKDYDWLYNQYITLNKSYKEISNEFGFNISTLKKWAHKLNIPYKGCGYKNVGKKPWNKGLSEADDIRIKKQADALRKNRYNRWIKECYTTTPNGSVILEPTPRIYKKYRKKYCEICKKTDVKLEVHHKDGNHNNFSEDNFITLCPSCHQGVENKSLNILHSDKIISIEYVGETDVYDLEVNSNYHNYIANGIIVHNCNYNKDKFDNQLHFIEPLYYNEEKKSKLWADCMTEIEDTYNAMIEAGMIPDEARMILPHSTAAVVTMTANIREWKHIFELRANSHAHPAVQQVMIPLLLKFKEDMPEIFGNIEYNEKFPKEKYAEIKVVNND